MNRTLIWKAEEKELSEKLYRKLQGLALLYPPTEDFRKCLSDEMFLKPNSHAFIHVMHFLFRLLDPCEFKRRFYWPVTDKRGEANFRSSTVEYLKHLNEKHQLQWSNIKSYLVVMPGGMKFITFLLGFVSFVVQELTRAREKLLSGGLELNEISDLSLKRMRRQNEFFKDYASDFISEIKVQSLVLCEKTKLLRQCLESMARLTSLSPVQLTGDTFFMQFEQDNSNIFRGLFLKRTARITYLEDALGAVNKTVDKFLSKEIGTKNNNDTVRYSLRKIGELFPKENQIDDETVFNSCNDDVPPQVNTLIAAFDCMHSTLDSFLAITDKNIHISKFVEMAQITVELQEIETQISTFQKVLNANIKKRITEHRRFLYYTPLHGSVTPANSRCDTGLILKIVSTPPIKVQFEEISRSKSLRLPLLDDFNVKLMGSATKSINNLFIRSRSARKPKHNSFDLNNTTLNKSKIIDSMQLLRTCARTISKQRTSDKQQHILSLGSKWKKNQYLFEMKQSEPISYHMMSANRNISITNVNNAEQLEMTLAAQALIDNSPPTILLNSSESARVACTQISDKDVASNCSLLFAKKLSAVKKVQDASLNFQNISTSPSGRLDTLVSGESKELSKLLFSEASLNQPVAVERRLRIRVDTSKETSPIKTHQENKENLPEEYKEIPNVVNTQSNFLFDISTLDDKDILFNISDSVLNIVPI